ncbi:MAG: protein-tyrosine phosphatase family protein [Gaiellaceae bacterium]
MIVTLPDGTPIRASSLVSRRAGDPEPGFGLYHDATWPAEHVDWPDYGLPADAVRAAGQIRAAFARAARGQDVEVGCLGGLGRTGTVLACMVVLTGRGADEAVAWVRTHYDARAIETPAQEKWVEWFALQCAGL